MFFALANIHQWVTPLFFSVILTTNSAGQTNIDGQLDSLPNRLFEIDFYANAACGPPYFGEGETPLGTAQVITDGTGHVDFSVTLGVAAAAGAFVTATATDLATMNTSEFPGCGTAVVAVFDPPEEIEQLIVLVEAFNLQRGLESSLDAKLDNALDPLVNADQAQVNAAIGALGGFINEVEAQKDKKISAVDACELIKKAEAIIAYLEAL